MLLALSKDLLGPLLTTSKDPDYQVAVLGTPTRRKLEKAVAVSGICSGVPEENSRNIFWKTSLIWPLKDRVNVQEAPAKKLLSTDYEGQIFAH